MNRSLSVRSKQAQSSSAKGGGGGQKHRFTMARFEMHGLPGREPADVASQLARIYTARDEQEALQADQV